MIYKVINPQLSIKQNKIYYLFHNEFYDNKAQEFTSQDLAAYAFRVAPIGIASSYFDFVDRFHRQNGYDKPYTWKSTITGEKIIGTDIYYPKLIAYPIQFEKEYIDEIFEAGKVYKKINI